MSSVILEHQGKLVEYIDGIPCIIIAEHANSAMVDIISEADYTRKRAYIAEVDGYYGHGSTLREAVNSARVKSLEGRPLEDRLAIVRLAFDKSEDGKLSVAELSEYHHLLTGSCQYGRSRFVEEHGLSLTDRFNLKKFIEIVGSDYGGEIIRRLSCEG